MKFYSSNSWCDSVACMAPACLYTLLTTSGHAPDEVCRHISSPTWISASVSSWTVCGGTRRHRLNWYITSNRCLIGFKSVELEGQAIALMTLSSGTAYTLWPHEARAHCTCVRCDYLSEVFIPVPNSSQGIVGHDMEVCVTLQEYAPPDHNWLIKCQTVRVLRCFQTICACHMCSVWSCSHLYSENGANSRPANSGVLSHMPIKYSAQCWAVSTPSWSLFLTAWSQTCTP